MSTKTAFGINWQLTGNNNHWVVWEGEES